MQHGPLTEGPIEQLVVAAHRHAQGAVHQGDGFVQLATAPMDLGQQHPAKTPDGLALCGVVGPGGVFPVRHQQRGGPQIALLELPSGGLQQRGGSSAVLPGLTQVPGHALELALTTVSKHRRAHPVVPWPATGAASLMLERLPQHALGKRPAAHALWGDANQVLGGERGHQCGAQLDARSLADRPPLAPVDVQPQGRGELQGHLVGLASSLEDPSEGGAPRPG